MNEKTPPPPLSAFPHVREERLRMTDLDFQKHVNNAALTTLLAGARFDFLAEFVRPIIPEKDILMIATMQVDFLTELKYGMPVFTGTRVEALGRTSLRLGQAMYQGEACAATSTCVFVHVDPHTQQPSPWPDAVRARLG